MKFEDITLSSASVTVIDSIRSSEVAENKNLLTVSFRFFTKSKQSQANRKRRATAATKQNANQVSPDRIYTASV